MGGSDGRIRSRWLPERAFGRMRDAPHLDVSQAVTSKCPSR